MKTIDGVRVPEMQDFGTVPIDLENLVTDLLRRMGEKDTALGTHPSAAGFKTWNAPAGVAPNGQVHIGIVTFPAGRFASTPICLATMAQTSPGGSQIWIPRAIAVTKTQFDLYAWNLGSGNSIAASVTTGWIAQIPG